MDSGKKSSILWRCRRGTREMDLLLQQFVADSYDHLSAEEQAAFRHLLDQSDPDIMDWILGRAEPPSTEFKRLIDILRTTRSVFVR
ncbi:MAG: succinate dehydrogenase assembly factor 2 [Gammaproteobacteria bacterium]